MDDRDQPEGRWERIKEIVDKALDLAAEDRAAFLDTACAGDAALRAEIESLLSHDSDGLLSSADGGSTVHVPLHLVAGDRLGPYEIVSLIGEGGMGEVYRATDTRLNRVVAIKVVFSGADTPSERRQRFQREARAISQLNHPNICTLYDVGKQNELDYLVMEFIDGESLSRRLEEGALPIDAALDYALQILSGLEEAHAAGIIHRDLKPGNVMLTQSGTKLLDFGLAKQLRSDATTQALLKGTSEDGGPTTQAVSMMTRHGTVLGTVPYMSPEQAAGESVNQLSDQFSFGSMLYEMLTGIRPFHADTVANTRKRILEHDPQPLRDARTGIGADIDAVVGRCLRKDPAERFQSTHELSTALKACIDARAPVKARMPSVRTVVVGLAVILAAGGVAAWYWLYDDLVRWQEQDTLAEIERLSEAGDLGAAFRLLHGVRERLPRDPAVQKMLERITIPIPINTNPPGADVYVREYATADSEWLSLGRTPLQSVRVPYALMDWRISKTGFENFEGAPFGQRPFGAIGQGMELDPVGSRPDGMVRIPGGPYHRIGFEPVMLDSYWLDLHEVTNREFKAFVDAGGYAAAQHWPDELAADNDGGSHADLVSGFVDRSGKPGPAGWEQGSYAAGEADYPVGGVSWYEAAAYCHFAGKQLPTLFHWSGASIQDQFADIVTVSNFSGKGPVSVGSVPGVADFGNYDMAGNVNEWVWNEAKEGRYILGGSWIDPTYTYRIDADARLPLSRDPTHGFRCARYAPDPALAGQLVHKFHLDDAEPANDVLFDAYRGIYSYDDTDLAISVDRVDETSPHARRETVSFAAAYGGERIIAHLFLPRDVEPPYQTVVWVPGNDAMFLSDSEALASTYLFDFIPLTGRALVYPVFKGTHERRFAFTFAPNEWRDLIVMWSKDLGRTVDYLEERGDIATDKLAYYGFSAGAVFGPVFTAVDMRFEASVILAGGLKSDFSPEVNPANFATRSSVPTLMINGKDDFLNPLDTSQLALFDLLGADPEDKRHARLDGGHIVADRQVLIEEFNAWMDRHLGPVD